MTEMHSRLPGFTYSACGPFTRNKERIQKFKETGDSRRLSGGSTVLRTYQYFQRQKWIGFTVLQTQTLTLQNKLVATKHQKTNIKLDEGV